MNYILLIYGDENTWAAMPSAEMQALYGEHRALAEAMEKAGVLRGGSELKPVAMATTLRFDRKPKPRILDGPFAETKEQLGGYYLIEVDDLEAAIGWAERVPGMDGGAVEIRPLAMGE